VPLFFVPQRRVLWEQETRKSEMERRAIFLAPLRQKVCMCVLYSRKSFQQFLPAVVKVSHCYIPNLVFALESLARLEFSLGSVHNESIFANCLGARARSEFTPPWELICVKLGGFPHVLRWKVLFCVSCSHSRRAKFPSSGIDLLPATDTLTEIREFLLVGRETLIIY
jgi:hypothetical protein